MEKFKQWTRENTHILIGLCIFFAIIAFASIVLLVALLSSSNASESEEESDKPSFYLGASFSGFRGMVQLAYNDGRISEEEYAKIEELEARAVNLDSDTMQVEDVFAYMEYAMGLDGLSEYFGQDRHNGDFDFEMGKEYQLDKNSFMEGFAVASSSITLEVLLENGSISYRDYKKLCEEYEEIYKNPTHQGCEDYIAEYSKIMAQVFKEEIH